MQKMCGVLGVKKEQHSRCQLGLGSTSECCWNFRKSTRIIFNFSKKRGAFLLISMLRESARVDISVEVYEGWLPAKTFEISSMRNLEHDMSEGGHALC